MERDEAHGKIEGTLREIREQGDYIPRPPKKVPKVEDYGRLRYLLGGDDCMIQHPTRRPESFLAYLDTFHSKNTVRNHVVSTHASLIPKSIQEAIKLRDSLQVPCRAPPSE